MALYKQSKLNNQAKVAITSFFLFCLSLFLTAYSARNPEMSRFGYVIIAEIQRPFQVATDRILFSVSSLWEDYINLVNTQNENKRLTARLAVLESMNSNLIEYKSENERLRKMLSAAEEDKLKVLAASIIGFDSMSFSETVILDRGSRHGIKTEMPVLQGNSVVGQIVAVSPNSSKVLLITDPASAVDCIVQDSRVRGTIRGTSRKNLCDLNFVLPEDRVLSGSRVITSGMDGIFPKGLLVGEISSVEQDIGKMFQKIKVIPAVDFTKLENVLIVTGESSNE